MADMYEIVMYAINLTLLISVIILIGYGLIKVINLRKPFRSDKQRNFMKWLIISLAFAVMQFSFRFIGDYQIDLITQVTHHIANVLMIVSGIGMIIAANELYKMKLVFGRPESRVRKKLKRRSKKK